MKQLHVYYLLAAILTSLGCRAADVQTSVATGADRLVAGGCTLVAAKRVGLVTNHSGRLSTGEHVVDALLKAKVQVRALFGPEHGIRGTARDGDTIADSVDAATGIPIYSLYGAIRKPTPAMLADIDVLVYDIQDVGVRFYTYISTMKLCMEAAAERGIPFIVLDRPDPLGECVDGPVLEDSLRSFVGCVSVPVVYGLTPGELALMMNERGWLEGGKMADVQVVWMEGWTRAQRLTTPWIPPSPNIKHPATIDVYPATCYIEATNVSEGRGTDHPFQIIGAPWIRGRELASRLEAARLPGVTFVPVTFAPTSSKHAGVVCRGVRITVDSGEAFKPVLTGVTILTVLRELHPDSLVIRERSLARLLGIARAFALIQGGADAGSIEKSWLDELNAYRRALPGFRHYPLK